jgi:uncharacterized protein (DUF2147 family)
MILRAFLAVAVVALTGGQAMAATVAGKWATGPKDVRYEFKLCGEDGQELCAWMTYAFDQSPQVQRYVGTQVLDRARRVGPQSWKGDIVFAGYRMNGKMTLIKPNEMEIDGCVAFIICGKFSMFRE